MTRARAGAATHARRLAAAVALVAACAGGRRASTRDAGTDRATRVSVAPRAADESVPAGADSARGAALAARYECNRCHEGTGLAAADERRHCVRCHARVLAGTFAAPAAALARWRGDIVHLREVPSLAGLGARAYPGWVARFLLAPHAVRPALGASMPRLALASADARDLAAHLAAAARTPDGTRVEGDVARGRRLYAARGCGACHAFTGAEVGAPSPLGVALEPARYERARRLAPDLRFARERLRPAAVRAQIADPAGAHPDGSAAMPAMLGLDARATQDLAAFVLAAPLAPAPAPVPPGRLPLLARPVGFDEVEARVLRRTCWHCHGEPDYARGEGGPGNAGGFGFAPRGVNLAHYEGVLAGRLDARGERAGILRPEPPDGLARLVRVLLARQAEAAGASVPGARGMPLGLPALAAEEVQLVESWVAQGAPP